MKDWRRSRPFWGGLLTLLAGVELLSIPFATKALPLVIQSGTVGATYLIALVMIILALLVWLQPGQRVFLGVVTVLVALAAFVYANLGGFLIGMLLGLLGGSLTAAWTPVGPVRPAEPRPEPQPEARPPVLFGRAKRLPMLMFLPLLLPGVARPASGAPVVAVESASMRTPSITMTGMKFEGVVDAPTSAGTVKMLRFTMDRAVIAEPRQTM